MGTIKSQIPRGAVPPKAGRDGYIDAEIGETKTMLIRRLLTDFDYHRYRATVVYVGRLFLVCRIEPGGYNQSFWWDEWALGRAEKPWK